MWGLAGQTVRPTRGLPLVSFTETARVLAGFPDARPDDGQGGPAGPTLVGLNLAREHGMSAPEPPAAAPEAGGEAQ